MSREQWLERGRWRSGVIGVVRVGWLEEWGYRNGYRTGYRGMVRGVMRLERWY